MRGLALCLLLLPLGCYQKNGYTCTGSNECVQLGVHGTCEPAGYCAFPDSSCPSGDRYEQNAGGGLGGQCVAPGTGIDAPMADSTIDSTPRNCGAVGMACCQGEGPACIDNAFCNNGTCAQCIVDIGIGSKDTCAIKYDGTVWCSGANDRGQLGIGAVGGANLPTRQQVKDNTSAAIADATLIHAGVDHYCVLRAGGAVWCWGHNDDGQIGDGTNANNRASAVPATRASDNAALTGFTALAMTHDGTCGIDGAGGAWCWGDNALGQVGNGTTTTPQLRATPVLVSAGGAAVTGVAQITGNEDDTVCLRTTTNAVECWGGNSSGSVGDGTSGSTTFKVSPVHVFDGIDVSSGRSQTCGIKADNTVWCWGGGRGRLGNGSPYSASVPTAALTGLAGTPFGGASNVTAASASCARMTNGDAYCWGAGQHGQTGTGIGENFPTPVLWGGQPLHNVKSMVAGYATTCAFLDDGNLLCWGKNSDGQLGDGTFTNRMFPAPVTLTCP